MSDAINPAHYKRLPAEAIEIIESAIGNAPSNQDAYLHGQVLKYILRCWSKNGIEDLKKAKWYLDRLIDLVDESEQQKAAELQSLKDHLSGKPEQPAWTPKIGDWVRIKKPEYAFGWIEGMMDKHDGDVVLVSEINSRSIVHDGWYFSFDWLEPAEQPKAPLNSDTIPEGYRKLEDSSIEPRDLEDLRWSVSEKRYVEISVDEIEYANRDNWAACRKAWRSNDSVSLAMQMAANSFGGKDGVFNGASFSNAMRQLAGVTCNLDGYVVATILEGRSDVQVLKGGSHYRYLFYEPIDSSLEPAEQPVVKQSLTPDPVSVFCNNHVCQLAKPTGVTCPPESCDVVTCVREMPTIKSPEVTQEVNPPDGWRFLEVGEVIRDGDIPFENGEVYELEPIKIGMKLPPHWKPIIRRNRFEVGEKVVRISNGVVYKVIRILSMGYQLESEFCEEVVLHGKSIAPYIEETK